MTSTFLLYGANGYVGEAAARMAVETGLRQVLAGRDTAKEDPQGRKAVSRLHGPEAGVIWTVRAALAAVRKVLSGSAPAGYQTPATAYGADFVLECEGVTREDVE